MLLRKKRRLFTLPEDNDIRRFSSDIFQLKCATFCVMINRWIWVGILFFTYKIAISIPIRTIPIPIHTSSPKRPMGVPWESRGNGNSIPIPTHTSSLDITDVQA